MNALTQNTEFAEGSASTTRSITIIYEDRIAGVRAKRFSDMLSLALGCEPGNTPACWRSELIDLPEIAEDISRDAAASEFVILSLRGDTSLSMMTKRWIESWLVGAAGGPANLVALFDPERSTAAHAESTRYYLRHITASAGVAFFAHCVVAPREWEISDFPEDEEPALKPIRCRRSRNVPVEFPPSTRSPETKSKKETHELHLHSPN